MSGDDRVRRSSSSGGGSSGGRSGSGSGSGSGTSSDGDGDVPRPLADSLDRVVAGLGSAPLGDRRRGGPAGPGSGADERRAGRPPAETRGVSAVFAHWAELVGPTIAAHARPVRLQEGRLVVATDDPAWASQLRWLEADLLARIGEAGGPALTGLVVRVARARAR